MRLTRTLLELALVLGLAALVLWLPLHDRKEPEPEKPKLERVWNDAVGFEGITSNGELVQWNWKAVRVQTQTPAAATNVTVTLYFKDEAERAAARNEKLCHSRDDAGKAWHNQKETNAK